MLIREIIIQGVFGCSSPTRVSADEDVSEVNLPPSVSPQDLQALLLALLYPEQIPASLRAELDSAGSVKLAAILESGGSKLRLLRKQDDDSLRLQVKKAGSYETAASGRDDVVSALEEKLGLPEFRTFACLNLWRVDDDELLGDVQTSFGTLSGKPREVAEKYQLSVRVETIEDKIKDLEGQLDTKRRSLGKGSELEEKLEQARTKLDQLQVAELSEEDLELLRAKDEEIAGFEQQLDRLGKEEEAARSKIEQMEPDKPWTDQLFWAGLAIAVAAIGLSVVFMEQYREVAVVNVLGSGLVAWTVLRYYTDLERSSVHLAKLESIKRRLNQVREEQVGFRERINHMLIHAGVEDENELFERVAKSEKLEKIIAQIEGRMEELANDEDFQRDRKEVRALETDLEELKAEREEYPDYVMSSFQLENDLDQLGVDPSTVPIGEEEEQEVEVAEIDAFNRLSEVADAIGLWNAGELEMRTKKMWRKICGHVLGDRFKSVDLDVDGELVVRKLTEEQLAMWRRTRASEETVVAWALALALHVNIRDRRRNVIESIWVPKPDTVVSGDIAGKFRDVFASAAKKSHIVLCESRAS
ncbi:MAG: hypothetical protein ACQEVA_10850 [Myxococcota bacterium]